MGNQIANLSPGRNKFTIHRRPGQSFSIVQVVCLLLFAKIPRRRDAQEKGKMT